MERQLRHFVRLVEDLLDVSRITQGKLGLRPERIRLADVVASALDASRPLIEARGHELIVDPHDGTVSLNGDLTRLSQALITLLNNVPKIRSAGAADLTTQLLAFSRKQILQPRTIEVNAALNGVATLLTRLIGEAGESEVQDLDCGNRRRRPAVDSG